MTHYRYLFSSVVGSHMWGMERPYSDIDLNVVYMADADDILAGDPVKRGDHMNIESTSGTPKFDIHMYEIGHLVHLLRKGNVNAIWAVCSPIKTIPDSGCGDGVCNATSISILHNAMDVKFDGIASGIGKNAHRCLDEIVRSNLSRESYYSIEGMAHSQMMDAKKHPERYTKTLKSCIRTCNFGINLLIEGKLVFEPVELHGAEIGTDSFIHDFIAAESALTQLTTAYENSPFPDKSDEKRFRSFLLDLRMIL